MSERSLAFIFPAFVSEYPDDPVHHLTGFTNYFKDFLQQAAEHVSPELAEFDFLRKNFLEDELKTQFLTYIFSCAFSAYLKEKKVTPAYCAGYSMGIYGAYFFSGVISFTDGLELIRRAFDSIKKVTADSSFLMGTVIGLSHEDLRAIIDSNKLRVEITNQNSDHSFVLGGTDKDIRKLLDLAKSEGALSSRVIPISDPYHTSFINPPGADHRRIMAGIPFHDPAVPVVSLIDRRVIREEQSLRDEIIRNLYTPMNWYRTQLYLQGQGVSAFIECGLGKGLTKNSKFVEGNASFLAPDSRSFLEELQRVVSR